MADSKKPEPQYDAQKTMKKIIKYVIKSATEKISNTDTFFKLESILPKAYTRIIKRPIDISEIMFSVEDGRYENVDELEDDFMLLCENAQQYNPRKTSAYKDSIRLESMFVEARRKYDRKISQKSRNNALFKECFDRKARVKVERISEKKIKKYLKTSSKFGSSSQRAADKTTVS